METIQLVGISPEEFKKQIVEDLRNQILKDLKEAVNDKRETYLNVKQISEELSVTDTTLYSWAKNGILTPYKLGGKTYFKASDIDKAMRVMEY